MTHTSSLHQRFAASKAEAKAAIIDAHPDNEEATVIPALEDHSPEQHAQLADYYEKLSKDPAEAAKDISHLGIAGAKTQADLHRWKVSYHRKMAGKHGHPSMENVSTGGHESSAHYGQLADYYEKLAKDPKEAAKSVAHLNIKGAETEADLHRMKVTYYRNLAGKHAHAAKEDLDANVMSTGPKAIACFNPSVDNAKAAAAAFHAIESRREDEAREEVGTALESLRDLRDSISTTNAADGFTSVSAYFANLAVEAHTSRLGFSERELTASFESAVDGQSTTIATESLDAALEAVDGVFNRMKATAIRLFAPVWTQCQLLSRSLDALAATASKHPHAANAHIQVRASLIAEGSGHSEDLAKSYARAAEFLKYLTGPFKEQAKADQHYNDGLVQKLFDVKEEYDTVPPEKIDEVLAKIASDWKDPRSKLGADLTKPLIGNIQLFRDEDGEDVYRGENAAGRKLNEFIVKNYPTLTGSQSSDAKGPKGTVEVKALGGHEIAHLAADFKAACTNVSAMSAFLKKIRSVLFPFTALGALFSHVDHDEAVGHTRGGSFNHGDGSYSSTSSVMYRRKSSLQYTLERAYWLSSRMSTHVAYDGARALLKVGHSFIKVSTLSLNAQAKLAVESWDQATAVDGVSVNETSPIEPSMTPNAANQAPVGEVVPKQETFQDGKGGKQNLNGAVESIQHKETYDEDIAAAEKSVGFKFDPQYHAFLKKHGASSAGSVELYGTAKDSGHLDAAKEYHKLKTREGYPEHAMPLESIGDGHSYYIHHKGKVHLWSEGGKLKEQKGSLDQWASHKLHGAPAVENTSNSPVDDLAKPHDLTTLTKGVEEVQPATAHTVGEGAVVESVDNSPVEKVGKLHDESTIGTQVKEVAPATAQTAQMVTSAKLGGEPSSTLQVPAGKVDATKAPNQTGSTDQSVSEAKLGGEAATGVHQPAAATSDNRADGKPVASVRSVGGSTDQSVDGSAALTAPDAKGVKFEDAQALDKKADHDVVEGVQSGVAATGHGGGPLKAAAPTALEPKAAAPADKKADGKSSSQKPATEAYALPYWFKPE